MVNLVACINDCLIRVSSSVQVLDATFDDILPLAVVKLPASWRKFWLHFSEFQISYRELTLFQRGASVECHIGTVF